MALLKYQYKVGIKKETVDALRRVFGPSYPDDQLRNKIKVVVEYPLEQITYPLIVVTFQERVIRNAGISHYELTENNQIVLHWLAEGSLTFTLYSRNPLERDMLSAALVEILAFGKEIPNFKTFFTEVFDSDYLSIQLMTDNITAGGDSAGPVPWESEDEQLYQASYSVEMIAEFYSDPITGELITIDEIDMYPYVDPALGTGSTVPIGNPDFNENQYPWT